ncbi:MAG: hypothetical protein WCN85_07185 [Burkholderiales bacterium]
MSNSGSAAPKHGSEAIPMLTEIVEVPVYSAENLPATLREIDWEEVAGRVRRQVSEHLAERIGAVLDLELHKALQTALAPAVDSISRTLHETLRERMQTAIDEAVALEIARLRVKNQDARP